MLFSPYTPCYQSLYLNAIPIGFGGLMSEFGPKVGVRFHAPAATGTGMKEEQARFLSLLGQMPVRLTAEQAGWVLNCQVHDIPALISARLLKPLGNPSQNSTKYFATADLLEITKDKSWLVKATNVISQHWQHQNSRRRNLASTNQVSNFELPALATR
jgi:hypothetical protein